MIKPHEKTQIAKKSLTQSCFYMGKSLSSTTNFQEFARRVLSKSSPPRSSSSKPALVVSSSRFRFINNNNNKSPQQQEDNRYRRGGLKKMDVSEGSQQQNQQNSISGTNQMIPLEEVVANCVKRWFDDTLKEAKSGDTVMQVLVGQMYYNGYGVPRDPNKGRAWITRASKTRSSVWKVCDKRPGYVASDSDSDDVNAGPK